MLEATGYREMPSQLLAVWVTPGEKQKHVSEEEH